MARKALDLWRLFLHGCSAGLAFGKTTPGELRRLFHIRSHGFSGRIPFSSWIVESEACECYFQGDPPRFWSIKVNANRLVVSEMGRELTGESDVDSGELIGSIPIIIDNINISELTTIQMLIRQKILMSRLTINSCNKKQLEFACTENGRHFSFSYEPGMRRIEDSIFDNDYFLTSIFVKDFGADAELGKTLPSGTESREAIFERIANASRTTST